MKVREKKKKEIKREMRRKTRWSKTASQWRWHLSRDFCEMRKQGPRTIGKANKGINVEKIIIGFKN